MGGPVAAAAVRRDVFFARERCDVEQLIELNDAYQGTAMVLGDVVEADDAYTGEHC